MWFDLTDDLRGARWTGTTKDFTLFSTPILRIERGIYVLYFENDQGQVMDRNGLGKIIVPASGASLKPGKFEKKLIRRMSENARHLHRSGHGPDVRHVFAQCLKRAYVLDLSSYPLAVTRSKERVLKDEIDAFILREGLLHASGNRKGDTRLLDPCLDGPRLDEAKSIIGALKP